MRAVFITHGSTGDTVPMIRLASEWIAHGHHATLLAASYWRETAETRGIRFIPIPPRGGVDEHRALMREFSDIRNNLRLLTSMFRHSTRWLDEVVPDLEAEMPGTDLLVVSYLFSFYGNIADENRVPTAAVHFCPNTALSPFHCPEGLPDPPGFLPDTIRRTWASFLTGAADRYLCGILNRTLNRPRLKLRSFLKPPAAHNVVLAPTEPFGYHPDDLESGTSFTGFLQGGFGSSVDSASETAFEGGPFLTFGSVITGDMDTQFRDLYRTWPADRTLTVQQGWFEPPPPPADKRIRLIGPAPHSDCFARASVVIHHGGAGTTTSGFFAGVPQIVVAHFADQGFWGRTVRRLGCGTILRRNGWGRRLADAVARIEADPDTALKARAFAREHTDPNSAGRAVEALARAARRD